MNEAKIADLWNKFKDIPTNEADEIDERFYIWKKGTDKMEIWKWFDEESKNGVYWMLNNY